MIKAIQVWLTEEEIKNIIMSLYTTNDHIKIAIKLEKALKKSKQS